MVAEGVFPKIDGDVLYASEANRFAGFGTGSNGTLSVGSNTTTVLQKGTPYHYTSVDINEWGVLTVGSLYNGKPLSIYCTGNVTINGSINLFGLGLPADSGYYSTSTLLANVPSLTSYDTTFASTQSQKGGVLFNFNQGIKSPIMNGIGATSSVNNGTSNRMHGGNGGASSINNGDTGADNANGGYTITAGGGPGGCTLLMIIGGSLTFGANSYISTAGSAGGPAGTTGGGGGGGGGGAGDILMFYNYGYTDNGLVTDVTGGAGGIGSSANGGSGGTGQVIIQPYSTIVW